MIATVQRNLLTANAVEMEVEGTMKRWLQFASDRECRRKRRLLQKEAGFGPGTQAYTGPEVKQVCGPQVG
ncbi:hypothetical protein AMELA_G00048620 [Ameiurus melas]|uniref:Uncharacterized protein n=1 Tax=Ameiurus melas TaxID=219545 RepID=A0A7J6B8W0_AMEME|nr:hypothetical protein AMELA_G00048620 [Ameiurus melas]